MAKLFNYLLESHPVIVAAGLTITIMALFNDAAVTTGLGAIWAAAGLAYLFMKILEAAE